MIYSDMSKNHEMEHITKCFSTDLDDCYYCSSTSQRYLKLNQLCNTRIFFFLFFFLKNSLWIITYMTVWQSLRFAIPTQWFIIEFNHQIKSYNSNPSLIVMSVITPLLSRQRGKKYQWCEYTYVLLAVFLQWLL